MEKLRKYVDELFKDSPQTKKTKELKEEMLLDLEEKYSDLIESGKKETEAFKEVVAGIGDVDELIKMHSKSDKEEDYKIKNRSAFVVSSCVGISILSLIVAIVLEEIIGVDDEITGIVFLSLCGVATCILIYHFMSIPKYKKADDTLVEEFKEWKNNKKKNRAIKRGISSILWTIITILYFAISFMTMAWHITWIIFIIGGLVEEIIHLIFSIME